MDDLSDWLTLHHALHATPRSLQLLLKKFMSPKTILAIFKNDPQQLNLTAAQKARLSKINQTKIERDLEWAAQANQHIVTFYHDTYPPLLKQTYDPPLILYIRGDPNALLFQQIAIVGSRKPSHAGKENATQFAFELSKAGLTVTSGLARGIDGCAHQGALAANAKTIAVLGCGANVIYPKQHHTLTQKIAQQGAIVSEYPLDTAPLAENFPRRNRLISALARATLVVEATLCSGSLITARFANEQGREVFAIPGSIHNQQASGCHHLIKEGACLVSCVQDLLDELNIDATLQSPHIENAYIKELDRLDNKLIECVGFETRSVQYVINNIGGSAQTICSRLLKLELRGYIKAVPGGYCRVKI